MLPQAKGHFTNIIKYQQQKREKRDQCWYPRKKDRYKINGTEDCHRNNAYKENGHACASVSLHYIIHEMNSYTQSENMCACKVFQPKGCDVINKSNRFLIRSQLTLM